MTGNPRLARPVRILAASLATLWLLALPASADCARDSKGEVYCGGGDCVVDSSGTVWCSRYYRGGAARTFDGSVVCGKGRCAKDADGRVFCSSHLNGAVLKDSQGHVRCYGRCERATEAACENTPADSSG